MSTAYQDLKKKQQAEVNAFPFGFAFGSQQFEKMMAGWGLTTSKEDLQKIVSIGSGGFVQKKDVPAMEAMFARHEQERKEARKADKEAKGYWFDMFVTELRNHEYGYTGDVTDTLESLNLTMKEINADSNIKNAWKLAKQQVMNEGE